MHKILSQIESPADLNGLSNEQLEQLAAEIRDVLCSLVATRTAHFASNLGVVELSIALHRTFDFSRDRLIWDTGHQIYPHKLLTGRYDEFGTIRTAGGLMGYPNPVESEYDLFVTGHAGSSVSTMLGLRSGDDLQGDKDRHAVAVIGDGAFPSGIVFEALNNAGGMNANLLVILNDNKMSICPRVGGVADYFDRLRMNPFYTGVKSEVLKILNHVPLLGDPAERLLAQCKEAVKAGLHGGMLFEELGFSYIGPIDGHNISLLRKYLEMVKTLPGPVLLHVVTEKGHGYQPAAADPVFFHTPPAFIDDNGTVVPKKSGGAKAYTNYARDAIAEEMRKSEKVTVLTAAMCQGTKMEPVRDEFPHRFFDVGICESHAVAFAAGQAKTGLRPIVNIYSTFLQRSFDQIFQEVALQDLPVVFTMDRAGLTAADGPTHHGSYDIGYMRLFPNMIVMAPGDAEEVGEMLAFALEQNHPAAIRYPKTNAETVQRKRTPMELGKAEVLSTGADGTIICYGAQLADAQRAVEQLKSEGLHVGLINARFCKPIDRQTIVGAVKNSPFVVTVEENALMTGFGSAVLEACADEGVDASRVKRLGIPDTFIDHGDREERLAEIFLTTDGIALTCREMAAKTSALHGDDSLTAGL
ncbi:1-deoxy-D-xylulose-5-phosphate synthase [Blastopirellula sp. JC732]|uniref:1-deoxy-D-xylulose-5-phosphate synthase n=1 Tax=Blastopirellula sediminis TaxID=2894196 RepID=A0A9X1SIR9_9BACT|nr:1-deoxy-D-xylulose-5-phosphate synthase [Blastopirellula sediminis]MCC9604783.1 1-deoxy-D-xylulose-5-phosphate synthase [Blastopirellula sediminis]MCC9631918.1 1-deoxy-D-xylulose-5-phosphate synthase [Blastopirellula sediminis]